MLIRDMYRVRRREDRDIGIEIELEGENLTLSNEDIRYWNIVPDNSLRDGGVEYKLRQPVPFSAVPQRLAYLQEKLHDNRAEFRISERCGVHIHLNCQDLEFNQVMNLVVIYLILEDIILNKCGEARVGNLFCLRARDAEQLILELINSQRNQNFNSLQNNSFRYAAINLSALSRFGSVEFRAFPSTENFNDINFWVEVLMKIKHLAVNIESVKGIIESISANGATQFTYNLLGPRLFVALQCPNMSEMIMDGVRRVQDIVYTPIITRSPQAHRRTNLRLGDLHTIYADLHLTTDGTDGIANRTFRLAADGTFVMDETEPPESPEPMYQLDDEDEDRGD